MKEKMAGNLCQSDDDVISTVDEFFGQRDKKFFTNGIQAQRHRLKKGGTFTKP